MIKKSTLLALLVFFAAPLAWMTLAPFSDVPTYQLKIPHWTLVNFPKMLEAQNALRSFWNSLVLSACSMVVVAVLALLSGYALSRQNFKGRDLVLYVLVLFSSVVQGVAAVVPLFTLLLNLGLLDTHLGVVLVLSGGLLPSGLFIIKDFVDSLPRSYEEASLVDGATPWQTFKNVAVPLTSGGAAVVALLTFAGAWGNFLTPYILLRSHDRFPASVNIYSYFNDVGLPFINLIAAYSLLYTLPVLLLFFVLQKVFGFKLSTGIKG